MDGTDSAASYAPDAEAARAEQHGGALFGLLRAKPTVDEADAKMNAKGGRPPPPPLFPAAPGPIRWKRMSRLC